MAGATVIGSVAVKIVPETGDFRSDAQHELNRAERALDALKIKLEIPDSQVRQVKTQLEVLTRKRSVTIKADVDKRSVATAEATLKGLGALSGGRGLKDLGDDFAQWAGELDRAAPKIATTALAVGNLGSTALTGSANLLTLGSSLATTAGAGLALPGILGGIGIGLGSTLAVLKDFNTRLPEVQGKLSALQDRMSAKFWAVAEAPIRNLVDSLLPEISRGLEGTSTSLGQFFKALSNSATGQFGGEFDSMFSDLNRSIRIASGYTDQFVGIIQKLGSVGAGNLPRLAGWFGDIATRFDGFLGSKGKSGLQSYVDTGIDALTDLGGIAFSTGSLIAGMANAAEASGASTLQTLRRTMKSAADVVNSTGFQTALRNMFSGAREGIDELTSGSGKQFESFVLRLTHTLTDVLPSAGRTGGKALGAIFDALDQASVQKSVTGFFAQIDHAVDNLTPSLPAAADGLAAIVDVLGKITVNTSRGLGPLLESLGSSLPGFSKKLSPLIDGLGDLLENGSQLAAGVLPDVADQLGDMAGALGNALRPVNSLLDLMQQLPAPLKTVGSEAAALGTIVLAGTWLGSAVQSKISAFSTQILNAGNTAGAAAEGGFLRAGLAAEGIASKLTKTRVAIATGAAALGSIASEASGSNKALSVLSDTATGAVIGSAFGPGWGTAIGAAGGALVGLLHKTQDTTSGFEDAKQPAADYAATLDQVSGAATAATRALTYQQLQQKGVLDSGARLGLSARTLVDASLGQANAIKQVNKATDAAKTSTIAWTDQYGVLHQVTNQASQDALKVGGSILYIGQSVKDSRGDVRDMAAATASLKDLLKGIPVNVRTDIRNNAPDNIRDINRLARAYDLTPKQVRTVVSALRVDVTREQVENLINKLKQADKTTAHPKVQVDTKTAEKQTKGVLDTVSLIERQKASATVGIKDNASSKLSSVNNKLQSYGRNKASATADLTDHASAKITAVRNALADLNGRTATTYIRTVHTGGGGGGGGGGNSASAQDHATYKKAGETDAATYSAAFAKQLTKLQNKIKNSFEKLLSEAGQRANKKAGKADAKAYRDEYNSQIKLFTHQGNKESHLEDQLKTAQSTLQGYKDQLTSYVTQVSDTVKASADITQFGATTYDGLVRGLTKAKDQAEAFRDTILELMKQGLNKTTLQQILAAGPQAGLSVAQSILNGGVAQINALQAQIDAAAQTVGSAAGETMFGDLVSQAQGDVQKLLDQLGPLQERMRKFARDLVGSLADALKKEWAAQMADNKARAEAQAKAKAQAKTKSGNSTKSSKIASSYGGTTVNYYAAASKSSSQEDLFAALTRAGLR